MSLANEQRFRSSGTLENQAVSTKSSSWIDQSKLVAKLNLEPRSHISIFLLYHAIISPPPRQKGVFPVLTVLKKVVWHISG